MPAMPAIISVLLISSYLLLIGSAAFIVLVLGRRPNTLRIVLWFGLVVNAVFCFLPTLCPDFKLELSSASFDLWLGMLISACAYAFALVRIRRKTPAATGP